MPESFALEGKTGIQLFGKTLGYEQGCFAILPAAYPTYLYIVS